MSGIAGFWNLNGDPADRAVLERMAKSLTHRGPHGGGAYVGGPIALVHTAFHETPESVHEQQPWSDESGCIWLSMDGRVDNREDLTSVIQSTGRTLRNDSDAELALRAYQAWGEDCAAHIVGDFGLVIWNGTKKRLYCARDYAGIRPLFYYHGGGRFVWASELIAFHSHPDVLMRPNDSMIGEHLSGLISSLDETLYANIFRLEPGRQLVVDQGGVRKRRFWSPADLPDVRYSTHADYAERFLEIFKESVRVRLRSSGGVGVLLSGGLDSAAVASTAQAYFRDQTEGQGGLKAISEVFPGLACDESSYIRTVVQKWELPAAQITSVPAATETYLRLARRSANFPGYPNGSAASYTSFRHLFKGIRVVMTGFGGDELMRGLESEYTDLLADGRVIAFLAALRQEGRLGRGSVFRLALRHGVKPLMPKSTQRAWAALRGHHRMNWLAPSVEWAVLERRRHQEKLAIDCGSYARTQRIAWAFDPDTVRALESEDQAMAEVGVVYRHPFWDRRIAEYCLSVPGREHWRDGHGKRMLREAMRGVLPEPIRNRYDKAIFNHMVSGTLAAHGGSQVFRDLPRQLEAALRPGALAAACRRYETAGWDEQPSQGPSTWALWQARGLDLWLRGLS